MEVVNGLSAVCNEGQVKTGAWRTASTGWISSNLSLFVPAKPHPRTESP